MEKFLQPFLSSYHRLRRDSRGLSPLHKKGILGANRKKIQVYKMLDRKLRRSRWTVTHLFGPSKEFNGPAGLLKKVFRRFLK